MVHDNKEDEVEELQTDHERRRFIERFAKSVKLRNIFILKDHTLHRY